VTLTSAEWLCSSPEYSKSHDAPQQRSSLSQLHLHHPRKGLLRYPYAYSLVPHYCAEQHPLQYPFLRRVHGYCASSLASFFRRKGTSYTCQGHSYRRSSCHIRVLQVLSQPKLHHRQPHLIPHSRPDRHHLPSLLLRSNQLLIPPPYTLPPMQAAAQAMHRLDSKASSHGS
jgi:hypothetical protein